jgi:hypothetical protein
MNAFMYSGMASMQGKRDGVIIFGPVDLCLQRDRAWLQIELNGEERGVGWTEESLAKTQTHTFPESGIEDNVVGFVSKSA